MGETTLDIMRALVDAGPAGVMAVALLLAVIILIRASSRQHALTLDAQRQALDAERQTAAAALRAEREGHDREMQLVLRVHESAVAEIVGKLGDLTSAVRDHDEAVGEIRDMVRELPKRLSG